ncbi:hypothetical protein [Clostridium formicaceticum]|uniref:Uncharacterized protein n=1 Tax=Clostridium formicaceticum TaxID=1497 RepID=A0AAC9RKK9_9CLOT|nr:hypothetical protein [Clostridium formicaceticum]AOY76904.1 hypothetical protein BJL90_14200 [Clostridium formicaceticum]ARE87384.1 hypothetical protein CLFO_17840 [Clostridium formicaceticum]
MNKEIIFNLIIFSLCLILVFRLFRSFRESAREYKRVYSKLVEVKERLENKSKLRESIDELNIDIEKYRWDERNREIKEGLKVLKNNDDVLEEHIKELQASMKRIEVIQDRLDRNMRNID